MCGLDADVRVDGQSCLFPGSRERSCEFRVSCFVVSENVFRNPVTRNPEPERTPCNIFKAN